MDPAIAESIDENTVPCPECGGDVCQLRDTKRNWTHRSRMTPRLVWLVLIAAFVGYWIYSGMWMTSSRSSGFRLQFNTAQASSLSPEGVAVDSAQSFLSKQDLHDAIAGDQAMIEKVQRQLQKPIDRNQSIQRMPEIVNVRFGFKEPNGFHINDTQYSLGGQWVSINTSNILADIRNPDSVELNPHIDQFQTRYSWFPIFYYSYTLPGGSPQYSWNINFITILGVVGSCMLLVRFIRWIGDKGGLRLARMRGFGVIVVTLLLAAMISVVLWSKDTNTTRHSTVYNDAAISQAYTVESLSEIVNDQEKLIEWCMEVVEIVPADDTRELLLGQIWIYKSPVGAGPQVEYKSFSIGYDHLPMFRWDSRKYPEEISDQDLPPIPNYRGLRWLKEQGAIPLSWGSPRDHQSVMVYPFIVLAFILVMHWLWRILHWISRRILARVQKRRVLRNQCIFCSYPLTAQAVNARYPRELT